MNRDDVIRMAREAGFAEWHGTDDVAFLAVIERFAALIAAAEREACARVLEDYERFGDTRDCIAAIRARGDK